MWTFRRLQKKSVHEAGGEWDIPQGLSRLRENTEDEANSPQGLKPGVDFAALAARLKPCPCYRARTDKVFPQPAKAVVSLALHSPRLKSCPDTFRAPNESLDRLKFNRDSSASINIL
jgi:hypothetical protein